MDPLKSRPRLTRFAWLRRWQVLLFLGLILLVQGVLAYLVSWIDPPHTPTFVSIHVSPCSTLRTPLPVATDQGPRTTNTKAEILATLAALAEHGKNEPVVVHVSAAALQADAGQVYLLPSDASADDSATWVRLRDVLVKLQACRARHKLLVLDLTPAPPHPGGVHHDFAAALPLELEMVPDAHRLVLCAAAPGQVSHVSGELGQSVFAHYFQEALRGHADGYGEVRDGRITAKELAAFVQARVERWTWHNRGEKQTPVLLGSGGDFVLAAVDVSAPPETAPAQAARAYPDWLLDAWKTRDAAYQSGRYRLAPRLFQQQQAMLLALEQAWRLGHSEKTLRKQWLPECERLQNALQKMASDFAVPTTQADAGPIDEQLRTLVAKFVDNARLEAFSVGGLRAGELLASFAPADRDAAVFAKALADPRLDPGTLRIYDRLLHPNPQTLPNSGEALRLRLLADLATRVEVTAWPRDLIETLLRATELGEKAQRQTPYASGYVELLEQPALMRHGGELRLWTRGYSNLDEAKQALTTAAQQFDRVIRVNEKWRDCEQKLDEALAELPWFSSALETLPELRPHWEKAAAAARALANAMKGSPDPRKTWHERVERLTAQLDAADKHARALQQNRQALHAPFAKDALIKLERQCRAPGADASTRQMAEAILSVAAPIVSAEERGALWQAMWALSRRLSDETLALDRQDNDALRVTPIIAIKVPAAEDEPQRARLRARHQLALLELAGVAEDRLRPVRQGLERCKKEANNTAAWCKLSAALRAATNDLTGQFHLEPDWRERERLAWIMPPLDRLVGVDDADASPTMQHRRRDSERRELWLGEFDRYLARDYQGLNFESPGIIAARGFYTRAAGKHGVPIKPEAYVRLNVIASVEPLTSKRPNADIMLEVARHVPPGAFGPLELQIVSSGDAWLTVAPESVTLPALAESAEPRTLTHKVPLKAVRKDKAERTGLPPPLGFLVEARFERRSYHHLVNVPIVSDTQEVQILVSSDPREPTTTLNEIRVRPGKVKQAHYVYVKNLTNRTQQVQVDIAAGATLLHKSRQSLTLEPDGVTKVLFEEPIARVNELKGPLVVRVLDRERQKLLQEKLLAIEIMSPQDYVRAGEVSFEPGRQGNNKWAVQVQASRQVAGPAIAAQLVLPMQRIPGLIGVGGGTLHVELPTQEQSSRVLFAEKIRLVHAAGEEGPVYLHIDGVARAFVYRTNFSRDGEPNEPRADDRPAVRVQAPLCIMAGINCLVDVEVDNAPKGSKLEIALGRTLDDGSFKAEMVREFSNAKKRRIDLEATRDALVFDASINDWTAMFDTRAILGARTLHARLLDAGGKELAVSTQSLVIDDSPPLARILPTASAVKKGSVLQVQAQGADPESGVAQVVFFTGRPDKGEIPPAAMRFKAIPASRDRTMWTAALLVPADQQSPLAVSVYVVNHAGLATIDTITLDVTEREPGKTGLGKVQGKVLEGPRLQPNLTVVLTDDRGVELARTRTNGEGIYTFEGLAPGRYRITCVKPESQRRADQGVIVEPDRTARGDLSLVL